MIEQATFIYRNARTSPHITLSMLAAAFLTITAHTERLQEEKGATQPTTKH
jgi:hypothetical protein